MAPTGVKKSTSPEDVNGMTPRQRAVMNGSIIVFFLAFATGGMAWVKSTLTMLIEDNQKQATYERSRSEERSLKSMEHGEKAIENLRHDNRNLAERLEKVLTAQQDKLIEIHVQINHNIKELIRIQKDFNKKIDSKVEPHTFIGPQKEENSPRE